MNKQEFMANSKSLRKDILRIDYQTSEGHVGGALSAIDILNYLYFVQMRINPKKPDDRDRDIFILSKGHIADALYVTLAHRGYFDKQELDNFCGYQSRFIGHPSMKVEGVEINTGALGHGLSIAVGAAIGLKARQKDQRVYCLMGDGEQAEGSLWEAAMAASHYHLDNLIAILDRNGLQISGSTEDVMALGNIERKYEAFGFEVVSCDGNDFDSLQEAFSKVKTANGKPKIIIAYTIKGNGVSFMENVASWHHGVMNHEQYLQALQEVEDNA